MIHGNLSPCLDWFQLFITFKWIKGDRAITGEMHNLTRYNLSTQREYTFSILIPTWNNLEYLKICVESINRHSSLTHQIILFVNEGSDGTLEWLTAHCPENLDYIHSPENMGICYGVNLARSMAKSDYLLYMNDDMVALPGWDQALHQAIPGLGTVMWMLSSTMIEPVDTGNNCVVIRDFGRDPESFKKEDLLRELGTLKKEDWTGATWPPVVLHKELWDLVGGFSTEFSPGHYSDPDLSFKLLLAGVREFRGVGSSLVYHFGSKTTSRIRKNNGRRIFLSKWGISSRVFRREFMKIGQKYTGPLPEPDLGIRNRFLNRLRRVVNC